MAQNVKHWYRNINKLQACSEEIKNKIIFESKNSYNALQ